jgi:ABC-type tungstate transport system permease subunit
MALIRGLCSGTGAARTRAGTRRRAAEVHHGRIDHIDRTVRTVQTHAANVRKKTGIQVRVVAQGTGQALDMGRRGDADVVFVHDKVAEEKFVADGFGVRRFEVMYNDFVLVGPKADPAKVSGGKDIVAGLQKDRRCQGAVCLAR